MLSVLLATTGRLPCLVSHNYLVSYFPNWLELVHPCFVSSKQVCKLTLVETWILLSIYLAVCTRNLFAHLSVDGVSICQNF